MIRQMTRGLAAPMARILTRVAEAARSAYNFDGVDDRGQLAFRAINPDGDIDIEWHLPETVPLRAYSMAVVCQNVSTSVASREFVLAVGTSGQLVLQLGGTSYTGGNGLNTAGTHRVLLVGNSLRLFKNGIETTSATYNRGTAREPSAFTTIGVLTAGVGVFGNWFGGLLSNVKINGTLHPMGDRNQAIQLPQPRGLGAELITQAVLENPNFKGSQWTYLGDGRWQLIGNGDLNDLRFLSVAASPAAGFLEFEIESITGEIRCANAGPARSVFNTIGVKRYFYTNIDEGGTGGAAVVFRRNVAGVPASCVIKNISFKPLGTCNPMTLVNTNPDRWQEVPQ